MTDPVPSKERIGFLADYWAAKLRSHQAWPEGQGLQAELLGLIYTDTIAALKQLQKPAHEREPPHCSTCGCGLAHEPRVCTDCLATPGADGKVQHCEGCSATYVNMEIVR